MENKRYLLFNDGPRIVALTEGAVGADDISREGQWLWSDYIPEGLDNMTIVGGVLVPVTETILELRRKIAQEAALSVEMEELKRLLRKTDHKGDQWAEGFLPEEEFAPIRAQRATWRLRIREIRAIMDGADNPAPEP